jgi:hypothetical protein
MSDQPVPPRPPRAKWQLDKHAAASNSGRGPARAAVLIALLTVVGGLAGLWFWIARATPPRLVTVPVSEYTDSAWPANPWAEQDSDLLCGLRGVFPESRKGFNFQERDRLIGLLESLRGDAKTPLVLHLSALACTRGGVVYLLPGQARPDNPATWLSLTDALDAFGKCSARHKLLLLDVARPVAGPIRGPLVDDVADRVHATLSRPGRGFLVLASCGPGEYALPMDDVGASAFAYYVAQGLAGAATRYNPAGTAEGRVTARGLAAFVAARVSRWAAKARGARQTPVLYGDAPDFVLTFQPHEAPAVAPAPRPHPDALLAGWTRRDERRSDGMQQRAPADFAALEANLLRAERAWAAGLTPKPDAIPSAGAGLADWPPLRSLVAATAGRTPPAELVKALDAYIGHKFAVPPSKPEDVQKAQDEFLAKAQAQRDPAARLIWDRLLSDLDQTERSEAKLRGLAELLDKVQPPPSEEGLLVKRLAAWKPSAINWPAAAVRAMVEAEDAAGRALALLPGAFPGVRDQLDEADKAKRAGEDELFRAGSSAAARAAAERLGQAKRGFTGARNDLETVQSARRAAADAAVILADTAEGVIAGEVDENLWRSTATAATGVADQLTRAGVGQTVPPTFGDDVAAVRATLRAVEKPYTKVDVQARIAAAKGGAAGVPEYQALRALLRGPLPAAPLRKEMTAEAARLSRRLYDAVAALDAADDEAGRMTPAPPTPVADVAETDRATRRVRISVALLRLTGLSGADRLDAARRVAAGGTDWAAAAAELHEAWARQLPAQFADRVAKEDWPAADRLSRGLPLAGGGPAPRVDPPPAVRLRRQEEKASRDWLENHYREYGRLRAAVAGAADLYENAAADCRRGPG